MPTRAGRQFEISPYRIPRLRMRPWLRRRNLIMLVVLCAACMSRLATVSAFLVEIRPYDRWYVVELQSERAGSMHVTRTVDPTTQQVTTEQEMQVVVSRGSERIEMKLAGRCVETSDGEPLLLWTYEQLGSRPTEKTYRFDDGKVTVEHSAGQGDGNTTSLPMPDGEFLTPREAEDFLAERLKSGADSITVRMLDPMSGITPVELTYTILNRDVPVRANGRDLEGIRWRVVQDGREELAATEIVDESGHLIEGTTTFGSFSMTTRLSQEQEAVRPSAAPELLTNTFIKPDRRIRSPRRTDRAVFRLSTAPGTLPTIPAVGRQTVAAGDEAETDVASAGAAGRSSVRITVDTQRDPLPAEASETQDLTPLLSPSTYVNSDDSEVTILAERASRRVRRRPNADNDEWQRERAEAMRAFVYRYVREKDLGVGFGSAAEVARSRNGDCTEHAVLLCAMLRAEKIPARIASGLIYADSFAGEKDIFGYHMWTQALIGGRWIDLDATLPLPFDATHITLHTSNLDGESVAGALSSIVSMFGRLRIEVLDVDY